MSIDHFHVADASRKILSDRTAFSDRGSILDSYVSSAALREACLYVWLACVLRCQVNTLDDEFYCPVMIGYMTSDQDSFSSGSPVLSRIDKDIETFGGKGADRE